MDDKELEELSKITYQKFYDKNEIIFLEGEVGDAIYLILDGLIKVFRTVESGREKTLALLGQWDFFGEMALLDKSVRSASIQAIKTSQLLVIDREKFNNLLLKFPQISLKIIVTLSNRLREANNQIKALTFKSVKERLHLVLLDLADRYGEESKDGIVITKKITHQELANLVGTTRETITKLLNELIEGGLIIVKKRYLILIDE
ncbi:cAMP-binding protein [Orenia metallireducens]|uniref:cAMP-binding protein n=2 Tax=Orenia metallireducens TaxID=1413210 RepID=A0A1C0A947_9FIRM|nr:cAMP-binding protein [Orenia metallireducens]